jgi:tRNA A-37 threonylcarbamoyl transferase component Bud32
VIQNQLRRDSGVVEREILAVSRRLAGSASIVAISLFDMPPAEASHAKMAIQVVVVIHDFQPKLMSYVKVLDGRSLIIVAVDQWVFERDVERGFLGEATSGMLVFPYVAIVGKEYLTAQELILKKRLVLEMLENLVLSFPELSEGIHIKPEYFMYEVMLNRVRVFPPLAFCMSGVMCNPREDQNNSVLQGYVKALETLQQEKKILFIDGYVMIPKKFVSQSNNPRTRFISLTRNAQRSIFTSVFEAFPQLLNFLSKNTEAVLKLQKPLWGLVPDETRHFIDPQKYVFVPTSKGLVSLADRVSMEVYARKMLLNGNKGTVRFKPMGGVLNDVYLIKVDSAVEGEKKVLVKRFKDWSGFKWFPLSMWALGARAFAVLGRTRLEKECAISEILRSEGFNVPKVLHISHSERLLFMEFIEGENLIQAIKRIAASHRTRCDKELSMIAMVGETMAKVHDLNVALGDTKPENVIINPEGKAYLIDFEQAARGGDKSWDIAEFLYFTGHYLPPLNTDSKAEAVADAYISGYLKGCGDPKVVRHAGAPKYTRVFSIFTAPAVIVAMSNACKNTQDLRKS